MARYGDGTRYNQGARFNSQTGTTPPVVGPIDYGRITREVTESLVPYIILSLAVNRRRTNP